MTHLAVYGQTGIGKTFNIHRILSSDKKRRVLFVRSLEDLYKLKNFVGVTDIIFDDISFEKARPELLIHLCDRDFAAPVRILRQIIEIAPTVNKWFTHNNLYAFQPLLASLEQQAAIERRLKIVKVDSREHLISVILDHINETRS